MDKRFEHRLFLSFLSGSIRYFAAGGVGALLMTLCDMLIPQLMRCAVDALTAVPDSSVRGFEGFLMRSLGGAEQIRTHLPLVAAFAVLTAAVGAFFRWFSTVENAKGGETLVKSMQDRLYSHIARLPFAWHMSHAAGDMIQRCTSDVTVIKEFCAEQLYNLVRVILMLVTAIGFMLSMDVRLTLAAMLFVPLITGFSLVFFGLYGNQFLKCDESEGVLSTIAQENLTGVRVVRAFGAEAREERKFREQNHSYTQLWIRLCEYLSVFWAVGDLSSGLQVMTVVLYGAYLCVNGGLTVGSYIAFISYNSMLIHPIRMLGRMISEMSKSEVSMKRIAEILKEEPEEAAAGAAAQSALAVPGDISFEHVRFAFGTHTVLEDVSFTVRKGETVGILGTTGAGKSTLMYLLLRLYELPEGNGRITVGGRDIRTIPLHELRSMIGIVLQEPFLFSRTIGDNILIAGDTDEELFSSVSETACLTETLNEFPKGRDTMVGERGVTLSGGQRQRVAIARMLAEKKPVMVFDDSLSAVDAETDLRIRTALRDRLGDATVFLISHRISTLMKADRILVLDGGVITECGTHDELAAKDGLYARIWALQSLNEEESHE